MCIRDSQGRWRDSFECASRYLIGVPSSGQNNPANLYVECTELIAACCTEETELKGDLSHVIDQAEKAVIASYEGTEFLEKSFFDHVDMPEERKIEIRNQIRNDAISAFQRILDKLRNFLKVQNYESAFYEFDPKPRGLRLCKSPEGARSLEDIGYLFAMYAGDGPALIELTDCYGYGPWHSEIALRNLATTYIKSGDSPKAWEAIQALASNWQPVMTFYSVLPSVLITDPTIREFLKGEALLKVLYMPKCKRWMP